MTVARHPLPICAVLLLALAACDTQQEIVAEPTEIVSGTPSVEATAIEGYEDLGGDVTDLLLIPNAQPFLGRGLVSLATGGFVAIDFAFGEHQAIEGPRVGFMTAAPDFQIRGEALPLVIGAGGELTHPRAWLYLVDDALMVEVPMDPISPDAPVLGLCAERTTAAYIDLVVLTPDAAQTWRISDNGGEQLTAEMTHEEPLTRTTLQCAVVNHELAAVAASGATRVLGSSAWGFSDGVDVASAPSEDGDWALVARPSEQMVSAVSPEGEEVEIQLVAGLNTPSIAAPYAITASAANFGASFNAGLLMVADGDRVNVIALDTLLNAADDALSGSSDAPTTAPS